MFDLDQAFSSWRRQMFADGIKSPNILDELESHLRDDVEQRMRSGLGAKPAFEAAVQQMGPVGGLKAEFAKLGKTRERLRRQLKGICCGALAGFIGLVSAFTFSRVEMTVGAGILLFFAVTFIAFSVRGWQHAVRCEGIDGVGH